ncbi:HAMP domain-containing histidine kinase [Cytophagales bacterium RKSG123]|nr:HAMP domain-containing histidine kinase [Xanthovirga aplysinae]
MLALFTRLYCSKQLLTQSYEAVLCENEKLKSDITFWSKNFKKLSEESDNRKELTNYATHDLTALVDSLYSSEVARLPKVKYLLEEMLYLIQDLVFIHRQKGKKITIQVDWYSLKEEVNRTAGLIDLKRAQKNIRLEFNLPEVLIHVDKNFNQRVFYNLLLNAIKFSPDGGLIQVDGLLTNEGIIKIHIKDKGIGMTESQQAKIFNKYYQVSSKVNQYSQGLGLSFCKIAVEAQGGTIEVHSELGKGSCFIISYPYKAIEEETLTSSSRFGFQTGISKPSKLSDKDKIIIQNVLKELKGLKVHQASKVRGVLASLHEEDSPALKVFKKHLIQAVEYCNEERFSQLINDTDEK